MADLNAYVCDGIIDRFASAKMGDENDPVTYVMQTLDSVTGLPVIWTVIGTPDYAGVYYPGPNLPTAANTSIRISSLCVCAS